jgi:large subunit ribosomal protein L32
MGALPKGRTSRARQGRRRSHDHLNPVALVQCSQCHSLKMSHHVCPTCGTYDGKQVIEIKDRTKKEQ